MDLVNGTLVDKDETLANNSTVDPNADVGHHGLVYVLVPILAVTAILILIAGVMIPVVLLSLFNVCGF